MDTRAAIDNAEKVAVIIVERDGGRFTHLASEYQPGMVLADDSFKPEGYVAPEGISTTATAPKTGKAGKTNAPAPVVTPTPEPAPTLKLTAPISWSNNAWTSIDEISAKAYRVDQNGNVLIKDPFETAELAAAAILP